MRFCKWNIYFWLVIFILVLLGACQSTPVHKEDIYFDTQDYVENEVRFLKQNVQQISAQIELNGKHEKQLFDVDTANSFNDLENLFSQVNLNKTVYKDQFKVDTFWLIDSNSNENVEVINYVSQNEDFNVKWLQVYSTGSLKAKIAEKNFLFNYEKEIFYEKRKRFTSFIVQKTIGLDTLKVVNELQYIY